LGKIRHDTIYPSRILLFDEKTLFWGTGNLTLSGLNNDNELFILSEDPALLSLFTRYLNTFSQIAEGKPLVPSQRQPALFSK